MVQFHMPPFQNLGHFVTPHLPVSFGRDTKIRWSFYLVSMPGEVKDPTQVVNVQPVVNSLILEKDNSKN